MERILMAALPLAFLVQLQVSATVMARRQVAMGGRPPIGGWFYTGKYLIVPVWAAAALQSFGLGLPVLSRPDALRRLAGAFGQACLRYRAHVHRYL